MPSVNDQINTVKEAVLSIIMERESASFNEIINALPTTSASLINIALCELEEKDRSIIYSRSLYSLNA